MFLSEAKTRFRGEVFDYVVEQTQNALHDPVVVAKLGGLASELRVLAGDLFLPDVQHGRMVIPPSQKNTTNPVFLPLTAGEARRAGTILGSASQEPVRTWDITKPVHSEPYDITMDFDDIWAYMKAGPEEKRKPQKGAKGDQSLKPLEDDAEMRHWLCIRGNQFTIGRPMIIMGFGVMMGGAKWSAGMLSHELVHVGDFLRDGPIYGAQQYRAATEYRAYHVDDVIDGKQWFDKTKIPHRVEAFRREHADPMRPFHPTQAMIDEAVKLGII